MFFKHSPHISDHDDSLNSSSFQDESSLITRDSDSSNERNSLKKNSRIARRAKSFKEDFLEKLSQIRTPTNTLNR